MRLPTTLAACASLLFLSSPAGAGAAGEVPQLRCGTLDRDLRVLLYGAGDGVGGSDCGQFSTNPLPGYDPGTLHTIPVWVHVIMDNACNQGALDDDAITSQIDILNEDFLALPGTNGANGTDLQVQFQLVGATRSCNTTWYNDGGGYWNTLARDPSRFLNIYSNQASGALGYVPFLPADNNGANVGQLSDRVVIFYQSFGRDAPLFPYHQGRTATHEVGHYLGLEHPFSGAACAVGTPPDCYSNGDLICDTNNMSGPNFGCPAGAMACATLDPIENYMNYSDDLCMEEFTLEQSRRSRCTVEDWRPGLTAFIFADGFESGDLASWSSSVG